MTVHIGQVIYWVNRQGKAGCIIDIIIELAVGHNRDHCCAVPIGHQVNIQHVPIYISIHAGCIALGLKFDIIVLLRLGCELERQLTIFIHGRILYGR